MNFEEAVARVLGIEGGYTAGVGDPGGETNWGISKRSYPTLDIKSLTRDGAKAIYLRDFWEPLRADTWPEVLQYQALDFAVNSGGGISTAIRKLQAALGVADDGRWGPVTQAAAARAMPAQLAFLFLAERLDFMRRLSNWPSAGRGWTGRIAVDMRYAADDLLRVPAAVPKPAFSKSTTLAAPPIPAAQPLVNGPIYTGLDRRAT